jgi:TM2 domain-containing membrane protein YozV
MALTKCPECSQVVSDRAKACPQCGSPQRRNVDRRSAAVLAILLGGIGAHRFYVGQPVAGLFYILFCWTLIPALLGLLEGVWMLCMSDAAFTRHYLG